jgi:iron donor protein CyaY
MIDEATFRRESDRVLTALEQSLIRAEDASDDPQFETEQKNGVLNILFEDGSAKFVFTPNTPVAQIWISAQSTSFKLHYDEAKQQFTLPTTGEDLRTLTERLLREQLNEPELSLR